MGAPSRKRSRLLKLATGLVALGMAANCRNPAAPPPPPEPPPIVEPSPPQAQVLPSPTPPKADPPPEADPVQTPPNISCPSSITVKVSRAPTVVEYPAPAVTGGAAPVSVSCARPSGALFSAGTSVVSCTATDPLGRSAQCSFQVTVDVTARLKGTTFLAFGDSITWGEVAPSFANWVIQVYDPVNSYPTVLQSLLVEQFPSQAASIAVVNAGLRGESIVNSEDRLVAEVSRVAPDVLLILHGTNDVNAGTSPSAIGQSMRANIRRALQRGVKLVLVATLLPQVEGRFRAFNPGGVLAANDAIRDAALREGAILVDVFAAINPLKEKLIGDDGLHPTAEGNRVITETFAAAIRANFEAPSLSTVGLEQTPDSSSLASGLTWLARQPSGGARRIP